jgi:hemoglobin
MGRSLWLILAFSLSLLVGCAQQPSKDDSIYQDLGQRAGIQKIVEGMLLRVAKDDRIYKYFAKVDIVRVRAGLARTPATAWLRRTKACT